MGLQVILLVLVVLGAAPSLALPQSRDIDSSQLPQQDINTLNCFDLVDQDQLDAVLGLNLTTAALSVEVEAAGAPVVKCLERQSVIYLVSVVGDTNTTRYLLADYHQWEGTSTDLVSSPPTFPYLIHAGRYRLRLTQCGQAGESCGEPSTATKTVFSDFINIQSSVEAACLDQTGGYSTNSSSLSPPSPALSGNNVAVFQFSFRPCSRVQLYDTANLSLYSSESEDQCGDSQPVLTEVVSLVSDGEEGAEISYQSPQLEGDRYYCLTVSLSHISCRLQSREIPSFCSLQSESVWVGSAPAMFFILPLCTDHMACAWLYIVIGAGSALLLSCFLAVICIRCCDYCRGRRRDKRDEVDFSGEVISLAPLHDRISWAELHKEWEVREDKPRGKILLLFSPDTKLFKELQEAFKSFLDLACHCDIYDLFDDALFDTIALDPSEWLQEFVNDEEVKILVISSVGKSSVRQRGGQIVTFLLCRSSQAPVSPERRTASELARQLPAGRTFHLRPQVCQHLPRAGQQWAGGHRQVRDAQPHRGEPQARAASEWSQHQRVPGTYTAPRALLLGSSSQTTRPDWETLGQLSPRDATTSGTEILIL